MRKLFFVALLFGAAFGAPNYKADRKGSCANARIVSRAEWGARAPTAEYYMNDQVPYVFVHHSVTSTCHSQTDCTTIVQTIQNYHMVITA